MTPLCRERFCRTRKGWRRHMPRPGGKRQRRPSSSFCNRTGRGSSDRMSPLRRLPLTGGAFVLFGQLDVEQLAALVVDLQRGVLDLELVV